MTFGNSLTLCAVLPGLQSHADPHGAVIRPCTLGGLADLASRPVLFGWYSTEKRLS